MAEYIMIQGTGSHVGKSILTTALCRIFFQEGRQVSPFKAQNMALNSYVTADGKEMGRAQAAQAEAAGTEPQVRMNPVLLKPTGQASSQVIINGMPVGTMSARAYHKGYALQAFAAVKAALREIECEADTVVIEGAGSPAEINLKDHDIVNMRVARHLQAPVLLVADIDRGGALAALVGTLDLLEPEERALVRGLIINKFRGDVSLLTPALDFLRQKTGKPVLGVIPFIENMRIDEEDSVSLQDKPTQAQAEKAISIAVIRLPKLSNFTDFSALAAEPDVSLFYTTEAASLLTADAVIIPGSKNTVADLQWLRRHGLDRALQRAVAAGIPLIGICGGYQMLGRRISDPLHTEAALTECAGLGFLPLCTTFCGHKKTVQVTAACRDFPFAGAMLQGADLTGYEIHQGRSEVSSGVPVMTAVGGSSKRESACVGCARPDGLVWGTYVHGIFDHDSFRRAVVNGLRVRKGLSPLGTTYSYVAAKEREYNRLADTVRAYLDMEAVRRIMRGEQ